MNGVTNGFPVAVFSRIFGRGLNLVERLSSELDERRLRPPRRDHRGRGSRPWSRASLGETCAVICDVHFRPSAPDPLEPTVDAIASRGE